MKATNWRGIVEVVGIVAIVASLIFVGFQIRQDQKIAIADTYGTLNESTANIADLIDRNAEIWKRGLDGEELSGTDKIRFLSLVKTIHIHFSNSHIRWSWVGPASPEIASRRYAYALYIYPGLRKARSDEVETFQNGNVGRGTFSSGRFESEVDRFLKEFDEMKAVIPAEKSYVFW